MCNHKTTAGIIKTCTSACKNFSTCKVRKAALEESLITDDHQVSCPADRFAETLAASKPRLVHSA